MNPTRKTLPAIFSAVLLVAMFVASVLSGQQSQPPIVLILDGQPVASLSNFDYDPNNRELKVDTLEDLTNCEANTLFRSRFEP